MHSWHGTGGMEPGLAEADCGDIVHSWHGSAHCPKTRDSIANLMLTPRGASPRKNRSGRLEAVIRNRFSRWGSPNWLRAAPGQFELWCMQMITPGLTDLPRDSQKKKRDLRGARESRESKSGRLWECAGGARVGVRRIMDRRADSVAKGRAWACVRARS